MSLETERKRLTSAITSVGRKVLSAIYPDEIQYHAITFELLTSDLQTVESFTFPVLSDSITEDQTTITNIQKSAGGVVVINNDTFVPTKITMSGTFGRALKLIIQNKPFEFAGVQLLFNNGKPNLEFNKVNPVFSSFAKTGYGCLRILEKLKQKHDQLDSKGNPYLLLLYAPGLGINYVVKINSLIKSENNDTNNMIPKYDIIMTSVAPLEALQNFNLVKGILKNLGRNEVQKGINEITTRVRSSIRNIF